MMPSCGTVAALIVCRTVSYCYLNGKHFLMKNATLRQLRVFASVARHLSFIRAAEEMKLTAPAVSMQIKELELEVGLPLFDRTSRQVSLTMVGEYMLAHTRRVLSAMRDAEDLVARFGACKQVRSMWEWSAPPNISCRACSRNSARNIPASKFGCKSPTTANRSWR